MVDESASTEVELQAGLIRIRVRGSEQFVKAILETPEKWFKNVVSLISESQKALGSKRESALDEAGEARSPSAPGGWDVRIAKTAGVSPEFVNQIFRVEDDIVLLDSWSTTGGLLDKRREIAVLGIFTNSLYSESDKLSVRQLKRIYDHLGVTYDGNLARQLKGDPGILLSKPDFYRINLQGRKKAIELLRDQEKALRTD